MLTKEQILAQNDLRTEQVEVPEWGGSVTVRAMTSRERDAYEASMVEGDKYVNVRARLVASCLVDENGERMFSDEDAEALGNKGASAMNRIFNVVTRINGFSDSDLEDLEKN
jgi:hypothetical protein